jgi:hypothetical protein
MNLTLTCPRSNPQRLGKSGAGLAHAGSRVRLAPSMNELPSGTVTFLFTDIEGSTRLERELRERYGEALAEHQRLLRRAPAPRWQKAFFVCGGSSPASSTKNACKRCPFPLLHGGPAAFRRG